ncbi:hypothetical protein FOVG_18974 [Fusarium oxysporum f. sp. pisi HDV247]|uniref:DUF1993 domain-containing protein n=1 Tax=Fusarium oxysporum f. sp. pisi HDV247 TaxID=1080344 RepID=W9NA84_FUSOX|nr:hypothetical protein FOVG_18974 [Fusarium oxysporum f. sp. pisi HDV247]
MSSVSLHDITVPVYIRQLTCLQKVLVKAQQWCIENEKPESFLSEASLAPDMKPLPFQVHLCNTMIRSGTFGPGWSFHNPADQPDYATDFPGMISSIQGTIDYLSTIKPGDEGDKAEGLSYSYWPSGKEGEGDPIKFASASKVLMQYVYPNFFFHMTTAYDICRHKGVPLTKFDFLLSAGMFA